MGMNRHGNVVIVSVLLTCCVIPVWPCPRGCECIQKNTEYTTFCAKTNFTRIPDGIPPNTDQLHMVGNRIQVLHQGSFDGLNSLSSLSLTHCGIIKIESNAFTGLSNLAYLDLQHNRIRQLPSYTFSGLHSLKQLMLSNNDLTVVNNFAFNGLNLTRLRLENNPELKQIEVKAFQGSRINELHISNSSLSNRSLDSIRELTGILQQLTWTNNKVSLTMPKDLFRGFVFKELLLSYNGITDARFLDNVLTDELSLEGNPTGPINFSFYQNLRNVRVLKLRRTGFNKVEGRFFQEMPHLQELDLAQNGIMSLPSNLQDTFQNLNKLCIDKNDIYCNCELLWFKRWLLKPKTRTFVQGASCSHPYYEDILFMEENAMNCRAPKITKITRNQNVSFATEVIMDCEAVGDPAPDITWHTDNGDRWVFPATANRNESTSIGKLTLPSAQTRDEGTYRCDATNIAGNASASTHLLVYKVSYRSRSSRPKVANKGRSWSLNTNIIIFVMCASLLL